MGLVARLTGGCNGCADLARPWVDQPTMLPAVEPVEAIGGLSAKTCGGCHREVYAEWSASLMAASHANPFYQADRAHEGVPFICGRCHDPLENQTPRLVERLRSRSPLRAYGRPNPAYDRALEAEGGGARAEQRTRGRSVRITARTASISAAR